MLYKSLLSCDWKIIQYFGFILRIQAQLVCQEMGYTFGHKLSLIFDWVGLVFHHLPDALTIETSTLIMALKSFIGLKPTSPVSGLINSSLP